MPKAAVIQMVSTASIAENLACVEQYLLKAREEDADLVVLPENFAFMGLHENDKLQHAETTAKGPIQTQISRWATQLKLWIIAGTIPMQTNGKKVRSASLVFDEKGLCVARYDKIHLFDVLINAQESYQESLTVERGDQLTVVETPIGKIGLTVCYDLRFPELYQMLRQKGAVIFSIPSAFTATTGAAHWEVLLRARAIENLCYVLAPNQGGCHANGRQTYGHSAIINPWGAVLATFEKGSGMLTYDINLADQQKVRKQFPSINHHIL